MSLDFAGQHTYPKARKSHRCSTCHRVIEKGERYSRQFCVWDGDAYAWKQCLHCEALIPYIDYDESFNDDDYTCWEPRNLRELRIRVHLNKKWRDNAGNLYPIPFRDAA
ncbi:hypothetical protein ACIPY0_13370 [Paenarthrobacter nicotinovorans]|uniref:hypothetical protein n=1 Tax=Paenarthrobacter nicotinovorans TaxID=29320 RepID=UPI003800D6B3